ncbi:MAG: cupin domain-containing protein [Candidatus Hydrothermia bacterium]
MKEKVRHFSEVVENPVEMEGAAGAYIRWLLGPSDDVPNFFLRMFRLEQDGRTPYHSHPYEHEVYILDGKGILRIGEREYPLKPGYFAYVPPDKNHQFVNTGKVDMFFLCVIPTK